jgi:hypothetical protein
MRKATSGDRSGQTYPRYVPAGAGFENGARARSSSTPKGFRSTRSRMVSNFTSACCTSRLARGNAQGQTHSQTSSNYLCTNDG